VLFILESNKFEMMSECELFLCDLRVWKSVVTF